MKRMKKLTSILLALVMVLSLAVTVSAAEGTYTLTLNNAQEGHTYTAYQIFAGDLSDGTLSNIVWGSGVTAEGQTALGDAAAKAATLKEVEDAAEFAVEVAPYLGTAAGSVTIAENATSGTIEGLEAGYYLVQTTGVTAENGVYTSYIMKIVGDTEVTVKADVPSVEKKVDDKNDSNTTEDEVKWQDSADYDIGDSVPFQLKATLANNVSAYDTYKVVFHDTLSAGLTYQAITSVTIDGNAVATGAYTVATEAIKNADGEDTGETALTITFNNVKAFGATDSSVITVEYTATLNENAVIGSAGNPNEVYLEYSNNPNWKPTYKDDDNNPDTPDVPENPEDSPTGETPDDKVIVFTYKTIVNKVDENQEPLTGATFTMYKKLAAQPATGTEGTDYIIETAEDNTVTYWDVVGTVDGTNLSTFEWKGLDDGDYKLVETVTPAGYNTIDPVYFTITATHDEDADEPALLTLTGGDKFTGDVEAGTLTGEIVNQSGATLPETGGMGTKLFYVIGGLMAAAAVVLLVTKKRMHDAA